MAKKLFTLLCASALAFPVLALLVQAAPVQEKMEKMDKMAKEDRWEGIVIRSSPDTSTLTVRNDKGAEMTVHYDSSTRWVSQEHGSKKVNNIDATQVKDNDRVIIKGTWAKEGVLHATLISKRLSH